MTRMTSRPPDESDPISSIEPVSMTGVDLRAACEKYAREKGWRRLDPRWPGEDRWQNFTYHRADEWVVLAEAIRIEWARDGIGGAS